MPTVTLNLPQDDVSYDVLIDVELLPRLGELVRDVAPHAKAGLILDEGIETSHGRIAARSLDAAGFDTNVAVMAPSEKRKSLGTVRTLYDVMLDAKLERRSPIVSIGGGITGDTAGFVAATYLRGVPFVQAPTTLLAMVDASVGGKVGVNTPQGKNLIGAFHQPRLVVIDVDTLGTLPQRELRCGLAECVKHAVIRDPALFAWIEEKLDAILAIDPPTLIELVERNVAIKAAVVTEDEREAGVRAHLNFGHTFAHAIEKTTAYGRIRHGEAVALGMVAATGLATDRGWCERGLLQRLVKLLERIGLPVFDKKLPPTRKLMEAMTLDKKVADGAIRLILPRTLGEVAIHDQVPADAIRAAWDALRGYVGD